MVSFIGVRFRFLNVICFVFSQGAVQGPEEFAEGFVIGVRSLFGHTVGRKPDKCFIFCFQCS